jgi:hypothetical protein
LISLINYNYPCLSCRGSLLVEFDAGAVDAVPDAGLVLGSIVEDMSEMAVALAAAYFGPHHAVGVIVFFVYFGVLELIVEGGPSASAVELMLRSEQRFCANDACIDSRRGGLVVFI